MNAPLKKTPFRTCQSQWRSSLGRRWLCSCFYLSVRFSTIPQPRDKKKTKQNQKRKFRLFFSLFQCCFFNCPSSSCFLSSSARKTRQSARIFNYSQWLCGRHKCVRECRIQPQAKTWFLHPSISSNFWLCSFSPVRMTLCLIDKVAMAICSEMADWYSPRAGNDKWIIHTYCQPSTAIGYVLLLLRRSWVLVLNKKEAKKKKRKSLRKRSCVHIRSYTSDQHKSFNANQWPRDFSRHLRKKKKRFPVFFSLSFFF